MNINELVGKTLVSCQRENGADGDEIKFSANDGSEYRLFHNQDCCESVGIEDICGELSDLVESPILQAEESTSGTDPEGYKRSYAPDSVTWTFYRITTMKGQVVIRWVGESNGYYSESVDFEKVK